MLIKSSLVTSGGSNKDELLAQDDLNEATFEDYLEKLNSQRALSEVCTSKDIKSVMVNVTSMDSIKFLNGFNDKTLYIDLFGTMLSLSVENQCQINIRGHNLEPILRLKKDILEKSSKGGIFSFYLLYSLSSTKLV